MSGEQYRMVRVSCDTCHQSRTPWGTEDATLALLDREGWVSVGDRIMGGHECGECAAIRRERDAARRRR